MKIIGYIHTDFKEKFGIPRQSGLVRTPGRIVLEPPYNDPQALRGLEEFSHIWVIWDFSLAHGENSGKDDEDDWQIKRLFMISSRTYLMPIAYRMQRAVLQTERPVPSRWSSAAMCRIR